ncbi:tetratricopeptide repeat protein [Woodsholea maritima]|uniref:tetratricopeptide repeat protein n=1 Tax=Woodsholea maritima TaxID=240237 RepID=UPI0003760478|nr:tetratricopeptide repeat protein [Woodsholea maritima]
MRVLLSALGLSCLTALAGCATSQSAQGLARSVEEDALADEVLGQNIAPSTASERAAIENQDLLTQAAFWAEAYELNPADLEAATKLSTVLRKIGGTQRAAEVSRQALALYPDNIELQANYGLALVQLGQAQSAIEPLSRAAQSDPTNWKVINGLGIALEQTGRSDGARVRFQEAVVVSGGEPSVMANLGLSYALDGDLDQAEDYLRRALSHERAGPEVRQNLALVLALQGRFDEAERFALIDSTPTMVEGNMAYVRALMSNPRRWDALRQDTGPQG